MAAKKLMYIDDDVDQSMLEEMGKSTLFTLLLSSSANDIMIVIGL